MGVDTAKRKAVEKGRDGDTENGWRGEWGVEKTGHGGAEEREKARGSLGAAGGLEERAEQGREEGDEQRGKARGNLHGDAKMAATNPSKRPASESSHPPAKKGHWSQGLLSSMNDPNLIVESDERVVIIKDKYPKVKTAVK